MSRESVSPSASVAGKVAVIGSGSWGTAITRVLGEHAHEVSMWSHEPEVARGINETRHNPHQLTSYVIPANVRATVSLPDAVEGAECLLMAVPSAFLRGVCAQLAAHVAATVPVLVLTKGVERGSGSLMADVVAEELGSPDRIAVLSGPNHAEEVCEGTISATVIAAHDLEVARYFQRLLVCPAFRVYVTEDVTGVELCAAEKNVIALACGVAAASGAGDNTIAALMTRGLAEISRIAVTLGADPLTCMGLAGMGDLVVTCTSEHSRNRTFGEALAHGESLSSYERRTGMVVEGAEAAASIFELARERGVDAPITRAVYGMLYEGLPLAEAIEMLLDRPPHEEFYGVAPRHGRSTLH